MCKYLCMGRLNLRGSVYSKYEMSKVAMQKKRCRCGGQIREGAVKGRKKRNSWQLQPFTPLHQSEAFTPLQYLSPKQLPPLSTVWQARTKPDWQTNQNKKKTKQYTNMAKWGRRKGPSTVHLQTVEKKKLEPHLYAHTRTHMKACNFPFVCCWSLNRIVKCACQPVDVLCISA